MCRMMEEMRNESLREGLEQGRKQGIEQGMKQGMQQGMKATALRMLKAGKYTLEEVAAIAGLSLEEVKALQAGRVS